MPLLSAIVLFDKLIFKAAANVNMNSILGWEKDGEKYSFLDPETPKSKK